MADYTIEEFCQRHKILIPPKAPPWKQEFESLGDVWHEGTDLEILRLAVCEGVLSNRSLRNFSINCIEKALGLPQIRSGAWNMDEDLKLLNCVEPIMQDARNFRDGFIADMEIELAKNMALELATERFVGLGGPLLALHYYFNESANQAAWDCALLCSVRFGLHNQVVYLKEKHWPNFKKGS